MEFLPLEKDIVQLQQAMQDGELSAEALTEYYLERISEYDKKGPKLNAIVMVNPLALQEARQLDEQRGDGKPVESLLYGIPVVIKDNFDTADMPTTASSILLKDNQPSRDALLVQKLREAGAIILAKTNLSEFARHGWTDGTLMGQTLNPYDLTRTPGGSSDGTGSAVAANFAVAGLGTDTANSVRSPSSATNLVGIRPTTGLLSTKGVIPVSITQDSPGTLTRTVRDAAILFDVLAEDMDGRKSESYLKAEKEHGLQGKRFGILMDNMGDDPSVSSVMDHALKVLREHGATLVPLWIPELKSGRLSKETEVQDLEFKRELNQYFAEATDCPVPDFQYLVDSGKIYPPMQKSMAYCAALEDPDQSEEYRARMQLIERNKQIALKALEDHELHAFVYPHQKILVEKVGAHSQAGRNGVIASTIGFPAITLPAGFSEPDENAPDGVPVGIEFMARPWDERMLFEIGFAFEKALPARKLPYSTP